MKTRIAVATLTFLLVASAAVAQPAKDAETRWHEAYVKEVVEGRIDEAAKVYLDLLREENLPDRLRRESEFRFAVCCALLGRADEGRSRLAGLLSDRDLPGAFRARVQEYLTALEGVGVGSELEKKLQELLFELGRALKEVHARPVYRDFQIIGKPAVPFLEKLLRHPDEKIRTHAYRILCEMREPSVTRSLPPWIPDGGYMAWESLRTYLMSEPERASSIETLLVETLPTLGPPPARSGWFDDAFFSDASYFTPRLAKVLAETEGFEDHLRVLLGWLEWTPELKSLAAGWIRDGRPALAKAAAHGWLHNVAGVPADVLATVAPDAELFPRFCRPFEDMGKNTIFDIRNGGGLARVASTVPADVILRTIDAILTRHEEGEIRELPRALLTQISYGLFPLEERVDVEAYGAIVRRWLARKGQPLPDHFWFLCRRASPEESRELMRSLSASGMLLSDYKLPFSEPRDVEILLTVLDLVPHEDRENVLRECLNSMRPRKSRGGLTDEYRRALARAYPRLLPHVKHGWGDDFAHLFALSASHLPPEEARSALLAVVERMDAYAEPDEILDGLLDGQSSQGLSAEAAAAFHREVRIPVLEGVFGLLRGELRQNFPKYVSQYLRGMDRKPDFDPGDARKVIVRFLADHLDEVIAAGEQRVLVQEAESIPLTDWVGRPGANWQNLRSNYRGVLTPERVEAVVRHFLDHPDHVTQSVMDFVVHLAPRDLTREFFDAQFVLADPARLAGLIVYGGQASAEAKEKGLLLYMQKEGVDSMPLSALATWVAAARPSERLVPVVKRLLADEDSNVVHTGIRLAGQLGREEFIEPLIALLDSMNGGIRKAAQGAADQILKSARLREEALRRLEDR